MSIQSEIARLQSAGIGTAREMYHALTVPQRSYEQQSVTVQKDANTLAFEQGAAALIGQFLEAVGIVTDNPIQTLGGMPTDEILGAVDAAVQAGMEEGAAAFLGGKITALFLGAKERGYSWPLPPHFGQSSFDKTERVMVLSQSIMEREGANLTIDEIKELMT